MQVALKVAKVARPTGRILARLLAERGIEVGPDAVPTVCYGLHTDSHPALNSNAGRLDKLQELKTLHARGVSVPFFTDCPEELAPSAFVPMLARTCRHTRSRNIAPVLQYEECLQRMAAGADYLTEFIPSQTEFRVWIYRRRLLGIYEKVLRRPSQFRRIGRSYDNGYSFSLREKSDTPSGTVELAARAVDAMSYDFGGVDILLGKNGKLYVLEVNSAPGVSGDRRQAIVRLADKITAWLQLGCPRRKRFPEEGCNAQ